MSAEGVEKKVGQQRGYFLWDEEAVAGLEDCNGIEWLCMYQRLEYVQ